ncbi:ester cyclase [Streptomyces radicis]|nr:ester cyclase [Streptomyces radicis]
MTEPLGPAEVVEAINGARRVGDFDAALAYIAVESLDQGERVTREDWRRKWEAMRSGVEGLEITTEGSVVSGDWVANRYTVRGAHTGDFFGQAPTGRDFAITGMDMVRVRDGQLVEHWMVAEGL